MMMRYANLGVAAVLTVLLLAGVTVVLLPSRAHRTYVTGYFENSNGIYVGDDVRILGVAVGAVDKIEPQPEQVKITFWFDDAYKVPADAKAAILSPSLVTSRAIQLTPAYTGGPTMRDDAVIPRERTAVPVEWDDFRAQLDRLTQALQPVQPGGVSTLGALIDTAAENLRGQGGDIRQSVVELSETLSTLGDHSGDIFGTVKNAATLVSALRDSADLMEQLNRNLAATTGLLANDPNEIGQAMQDLNAAVGNVAGFINDNREALGTTSDKLASISTALTQSMDDIKQALHVAPTAFQNFINIYEPAHGSLVGTLAATNFSDPISFLCGAIQAASRLGAEQSSKLCVQYLAPIMKNRQYNFPPLGFNFLVGTKARPNELTYSEDWLRPDHVPPPAPPPASTDPAQGLPGLMAPTGSGS